MTIIRFKSIFNTRWSFLKSKPVVYTNQNIILHQATLYLIYFFILQCLFMYIKNIL